MGPEGFDREKPSKKRLKHTCKNIACQIDIMKLYGIAEVTNPNKKGFQRAVKPLTDKLVYYKKIESNQSRQVRSNQRNTGFKQ